MAAQYDGPHSTCQGLSVSCSANKLCSQRLQNKVTCC